MIPAFKHPGNYKASPYLGGPAPKRDIFAFFMGDMRQNPGQDPHCLYSRWGGGWGRVGYGQGLKQQL